MICTSWTNLVNATINQYSQNARMERPGPIRLNGHDFCIEHCFSDRLLGPFAFPYSSALVSTPGPLASVDSGLVRSGSRIPLHNTPDAAYFHPAEVSATFLNEATGIDEDA